MLKAFLAEKSSKGPKWAYGFARCSFVFAIKPVKLRLQSKQYANRRELKMFKAVQGLQQKEDGALWLFCMLFAVPFVMLLHGGWSSDDKSFSSRDMFYWGFGRHVGMDLFKRFQQKYPQIGTGGRFGKQSDHSSKSRRIA